MNSHALLGVYAFLFGLALGSFMNVCIYRLPRRKSIVYPPSACPYCGERIRFYHNIPLISYLILLGRCKHCGRPIPWHYPAVEALAGWLSLALFIRYGVSYQYVLFLFFIATLVTISFIDLFHQIIPDVLSLSGIAVGWGAVFVTRHISWTDSLIGIVAGGGGLLLIAWAYKGLTGREGMGGGDVKLLAMIGAWLGWRSLPFVVLISSMTGALAGLIFILAAGKGYRVKIPFGPFLSLGTLIFFFFGPQLTRWYFHLLN